MAQLSNIAKIGNMPRLVKAPKKVHDALDLYWAAQKAFVTAKEEQPRDALKVANLARANAAAHDKFEQLLNG